MALANTQVLPETAPQPASTLEVTGHSMRFFLRPGDAVRYERAQTLSLGDLIVFLDERKLVVHRVVARRGSGAVTKGDALRRFDAVVPAAGVVGRVTAVRRGACDWRRIDDSRGRLWSCAWGLFSTVWFFLGLPGDEWMSDKAKQSKEAIRRIASFAHRVKHAFYWFLSAVYRLVVWIVQSVLHQSLHFLRLTAGLTIRFCLFIYSALHAAAHRLKHGSIWLAGMIARESVALAERAANATGALWRGFCARLAPAAGALSVSTPSPLKLVLEELSRACDAAAFPVERRLRALTPSVTRWAGEVTLIGDVVVPQGCAIVAAPGTIVRAPRAPALSLGLTRQAFGRRHLATAADRCHVVVFGSLELRGREGAEIVFEGPACGGVVLAGRGALRAARAELSVTALDRSRAVLARCAADVSAGGRALARLRSCRLRGERGLSLHDDARIRASSCEANGSRWAVVADGGSRLRWRGGALNGCGDCAASLGGSARATFSGAAWSGSARALCARDEARATLRRCRLEGNASGVEALGRAAARLEACSVSGGAHGVWAQNESCVECRGTAWSGCAVGVRASHAARVVLSGGSVAGCGKAGLYAEDRARAAASGALLEGNENGALILQDARLRLDACRVVATKDTAVWCDYRGWIDAAASDYRGNFKDFHREYRPVYG